MSPPSRASILALVALLAVSAAAEAVTRARLNGTVRDENGNPLPGVRITVTLEDVSTYRLEQETNAKGEYGITILDATHTYTYTFEKEGYQTHSEEIKLGIGSSETRDFELLTLEEARRRGASGAEPGAAERALLVYNEGAEASQMGDVATARAKFEEALALDPGFAPPLAALATLAWADGDIEAAVGLAEKARGVDPENLNALRILVEGYGRLGEAEKAAEAAAALAVLDPKSGASDLYKQGVEAYNAGDNARAVELLEQVLEIDAEHAKAHYILGLCMAGSDAAAAREHFEAFLRLAPDDPDAPTAREMLDYL